MSEPPDLLPWPDPLLVVFSLSSPLVPPDPPDPPDARDSGLLCQSSALIRSSYSKLPPLLWLNPSRDCISRSVFPLRRWTCVVSAPEKNINPPLPLVVVRNHDGQAWRTRWVNQRHGYYAGCKTAIPLAVVLELAHPDGLASSISPINLRKPLPLSWCSGLAVWNSFSAHVDQLGGLAHNCYLF
ncbi:unnamed protein product [Arabis nemorensis]|uniref:Uncharacterized protein n=1 Tax=Arabis nemorensis TaxID=586526 RepID=A0A565CGG4_9BRAS|nr:unnamed protein product [Arabis nemorensis]